MLAGGNQGMLQLEADRKDQTRDEEPAADARFVMAGEATLTFDIGPGEMAHHLRSTALKLVTGGIRDQAGIAAFLQGRGLDASHVTAVQHGLRRVLASGAIERAADRWAVAELTGERRTVGLDELVGGNVGGSSMFTSVVATLQLSGELIDASIASYAVNVVGVKSQPPLQVGVGKAITPPSPGGAAALGGLTSLVGYVVHRAVSGDDRPIREDLKHGAYEVAKGATAAGLSSALVAGIASRVVASVVGFGLGLAISILLDVLVKFLLPLLGPLLLEAAGIALPVLMSPGLHMKNAAERDSRARETESYAGAMGMTPEALALAPQLATEYVAYIAAANTGR